MSFKSSGEMVRAQVVDDVIHVDVTSAENVRRLAAEALSFHRDPTTNSLVSISLSLVVVAVVSR